ncbi:TrmB family transcriptional regulator [Halopenitus salinus]|uniref:TrmB family transcriptional regulator n=1 Tax=Halopenitus salinus TaxID=1198295 RepID=A0ABD5URY8_9EURY
METAELSNTHERILVALVNEYRPEESPVKARTLGRRIDRNAGSVRNQMHTLKQLRLVDGVTGPQGGYEPTDRAFDLLDREKLDDAESMVLSREYDRISVTVDDIDFINVDHPTECKAYVHFRQVVSDLEAGDPIVVGPTPVSRLGLVGRVTALSDTSDTVLVDVERIEAPLEDG